MAGKIIRTRCSNRSAYRPTFPGCPAWFRRLATDRLFTAALTGRPFMDQGCMVRVCTDHRFTAPPSTVQGFRRTVCMDRSVRCSSMGCRCTDRTARILPAMCIVVQQAFQDALDTAMHQRAPLELELELELRVRG